MTKAQYFSERHQIFRKELLDEIYFLVQRHKNIEMEIEFSKPIFYGSGVDEQDNPPEIETITDSGMAVIFYQGDEIEQVKLESLDTDMLIQILEGVELSLKEAETFLSSDK